MRAIFLDRDGVINENRTDHVKSWDEFSFLPGALTALRWLRMAGFQVFVVTNQAIVSRGLASASEIEDINMRMSLQVALHGGFIQDLRYCPHDLSDNCTCRKPHPGMLLDLANAWRIDLSRAYLVGDALTDIAAGTSVGCRSLLVRTGRGGEQCNLPEVHQHQIAHIAADLIAAVEWVFHEEGLTLPSHDHAQWRRQNAVPAPLIALQVGS